jgi:tetratricopeptide (TPR) repeat protein
VMCAADDANDTLATTAQLWLATIIAADRREHARAMPLITKCVEVADRAANQQDLAKALALRAYCAQMVAEPEAARRDAERGLSIAREVGNRHVTFSCLLVLSLIYGQANENQKAIEIGDEATVLAKDLGDASYRGMALYMRIRIRLLARDYEVVPALCEEGIEMTDEVGHEIAAGHFHEQWGYAHLELGQQERAVAHLVRALETFNSTQSAMAADTPCCCNSRACAHLDQCVAFFNGPSHVSDAERVRVALEMVTSADGSRGA